MSFSNNAITSIRNNRSLIKSKGSYFKDKGRTTLPPTSKDFKKNETSYADLRAKMEINEVRIFLVFGAVSIGIGVLLTMWFL